MPARDDSVARRRRAEQLLAELRAAQVHGDDEQRIVFEIDGRAVGIVRHDDARLLAASVPGLVLDDDALCALPRCAGDERPLLDAIARVLFDTGRIGRWRDEALPVLADDGSMLGVIERAAVRALGIRTLSTHLVACTPDGHFWMQRRAYDKSIDPGKLDTLAGGLIAAQRSAGGGWEIEPLLEAMRRETWEEAGLRADQYPAPIHVDTERIVRPVPEGHLREDVTVFATQLAVGTEPVNRDGEVAEFLRMDVDALLASIAGAQLTVEAALSCLLSLLSPRSPCRFAVVGAPQSSVEAPRTPPAGPAR